MSEPHPLIDALMSDEVEDWNAYVSHLKAKLTPAKRFAMALAVLRSCEEEDCQEILAVMSPMTPPGVPLDRNVRQEAQGWAALAEEKDLKVYAAAIWERMDVDMRAAFRRWAGAQEQSPIAAE